MMGKIFSNLGVYGFTHALIDATCAAVLFSLLNLENFISLVILYSILAFGLQLIIGLFVDRFKLPRFSAIFGSVLTAASAIAVLFSPIVAIVLAGLGNALFHVGGGTISLNLTPRKASAPGVFVAPGALGLFIGTLVGIKGYFIGWPFVILIGIACVFMFMVKSPKINYKKETIRTNYFEIIILLLLVAIAVRAFIGAAIIFPWKSNINLTIILIMAVVLGKGLGGMLADRFGWMKVAAGGLLISAPLISFGMNIPYVAIAGMFLFNMTMPVTLVAISNMFPGRPGFSFGLTCLALILGTLPTFSQVKNLFNGQLEIFIVVIISVIALYLGLRLYFKLNGSQNKIYKLR